VSEPGSRVVITGLGLVTPLGIGVGAFRSGLERGLSTATPISRFDVTGWNTRFACQVPDAFESLAASEMRKSLKLMGRASQFAALAAALALDDAGLPRKAPVPETAGVVLGVGGVGLHDLEHTGMLARVAADVASGTGPMRVPQAVERHMNPLVPLKLLPNISASHISIAHDLRGESTTVCTACTSATQALGEAFRTLRSGHQDWMLSGGSDAMVNPTGILGFGLLGVLSRRNESPSTASRPFDRSRDGFVMGEGAALLGAVGRESRSRAGRLRQCARDRDADERPHRGTGAGPGLRSRCGRHPGELHQVADRPSGSGGRRGGDRGVRPGSPPPAPSPEHQRP